jgi:flagellar hook protein FlgE
LFGTAIGETGNATSTEFAMNMHTSALIAFDSSGQMVGMRPARVEGARPATLADPRAATNISFSPTLAGNPAPSAALGQPLNLAGDVIPGSFFNQILIKPIAGVAPAATLGNVGFNNESQFSPGPPPPGTPVQGTVMTSVGSLTINMSEMFQRGGENTNLRSLTQNGNGPGELRDITIGGDGTIIGRFSNGRTRVLGQIPLAQFTNPAGLERLGANLWAETANSGMFDGVGVIGQMQGGALEMSNVDLAGEFTDMITTQRGFQAASRTITVSDEMLQELVNLRR